VRTRASGRLAATLAALVLACPEASATSHPRARRPTASHRARSTPHVTPTPIASAADLEALGGRLRVPIADLTLADVHDTFAEARGGHRHEATDIIAPRGTPVLAVDNGKIAKLFTSVPGGLTIYQTSDDGLWTYYAHLDRYAEGLREGADVRSGDLLGYVGTTGNAGTTPHLHFAIFKRDAQSRWWEGTAVDPFPLLRMVVAK